MPASLRICADSPAPLLHVHTKSGLRERVLSLFCCSEFRVLSGFTIISLDCFNLKEL